jgi:hypothetical protein
MHGATALPIFDESTSGVKGSSDVEYQHLPRRMQMHDQHAAACHEDLRIRMHTLKGGCDSCACSCSIQILAASILEWRSIDRDVPFLR